MIIGQVAETVTAQRNSWGCWSKLAGSNPVLTTMSGD